jgi:hypothetical protein
MFELMRPLIEKAESNASPLAAYTLSRRDAFDSKPKLRVPSGSGDVVHQKGHREHDNRSCRHRHKSVKIARVMDLLSPDDGNESSGTPRRVKGFGCVHDRNGSCNAFTETIVYQTDGGITGLLSPVFRIAHRWDSLLG